MSKPRIEVHPWLTEGVTREEPLKMVCPCCTLAFYWVEHRPWCSAECSEVEQAARLLEEDRGQGIHFSNYGTDPDRIVHEMMKSLVDSGQVEEVSAKNVSTEEELKQGILKMDVEVQLPPMITISLDFEI